jgi:hypothetical protein
MVMEEEVENQLLVTVKENFVYLNLMINFYFLEWNELFVHELNQVKTVMAQLHLKMMKEEEQYHH